MAMQGTEGRGCQVCEANNKLICPACFKKSVVTDKVLQRLEAAKLQRSQAQEKLQGTLLEKERHQRQEAALKAVRRSIRAARKRAERAAARKAEATRELLARQEAERKRSKRLREETAEVKRKKEVQQSAALADLQQRLLLLNVLRDELGTELRKHVRVLLEILPLNFPRPASNARPAARVENGTSPTVSICGCQLPNSLSLPFGGKQQELGTGLGYAALMAETLSYLLRAPPLNLLHFKGSTSEVWLPRSFWDDRPCQRGATHRLYYSQTLPQPAHPPAPTPPTSGALAALKHHWPWEGTFKSTAAAAPSTLLTERRQKEELAAAIHQLTRSIGALRAEHNLHSQLRLPQEWSPFAALAGLCMQLAAEPRFDGRRSLTASLAAPALLRGADSMALLEGFMLGGEQDDQEDDGWDLVQRPAGWSASQRARPDHLRMPPTPSDEDELITHWERAMITDSSSNRYRPAHPPQFALGRRMAPIGQGAIAAADRLWQGFKWST